MRVLVISYAFPWPPTAGARLRLLNVLEGLSEVGEVDLVSLVSPARTTGEEPCLVPDGASVARTHVLPRARPPRGWAGRLPEAARLPLAFAGTDWTAQRRTVAGLLAAGNHDVVWFHHAQTWLAVGPAATDFPFVIDFDDLEDQKAKGRATLRWGARPRPTARQAAAAAVARLDAASWARAQRRLISSAAAIVVCSALDRARLGEPRAKVVPNGYERPAEPARGQLASPTIVFQGSLSYEPNLDAARHLVVDIAPRIWEQQPDVRIRLVGKADSRAQQLARDPRVTVTGFVPDIVAELRRASVIAVPVRYGGGTRVKVLEAFAHRIPVVATTTGAEGILASDGEHLLLRDEPETFATACLALLLDGPERRALTEAAHALFLERYEWARIRPLIADAARAAAGSDHEPCR